MQPRLKAAPAALYKGVDAAGKSRGEDDADKQDEADIFFLWQCIEGDDRNQIGQAELGPRGDERNGQHAFDDIQNERLGDK